MTRSTATVLLFALLVLLMTGYCARAFASIDKKLKLKMPYTQIVRPMTAGEWMACIRERPRVRRFDCIYIEKDFGQ